MRIIFYDNISTVKSCVFVSVGCLESELVMPDLLMKHSSDLTGQTGLQKTSETVCDSI